MTLTQIFELYDQLTELVQKEFVSPAEMQRINRLAKIIADRIGYDKQSVLDSVWQ